MRKKYPNFFTNKANLIELILYFFKLDIFYNIDYLEQDSYGIIISMQEIRPIFPDKSLNKYKYFIILIKFIIKKNPIIENVEQVKLRENEIMNSILKNLHEYLKDCFEYANNNKNKNIQILVNFLSIYFFELIKKETKTEAKKSSYFQKIFGLNHSHKFRYFPKVLKPLNKLIVIKKDGQILVQISDYG